jgi:hypothetical protein
VGYACGPAGGLVTPGPGAATRQVGDRRRAGGAGGAVVELGERVARLTPVAAGGTGLS